MSIDYQYGYTSPMYRETRWPKPGKKRNPIGFVHFGEPEEDYLDEFMQVVMDGLDDDGPQVGFTADLPF